MTDNGAPKFVVWERLNKTDKWCPYSAEICQLIENSFKKNLEVVSLGDVDKDLEIYSVNLKDMIQTSKTTGTKSKVRRQLCDSLNAFCSGYTWQWSDGQDVWHSYNVDVNNFIEKARLQGKKSVTLKKVFHDYNYEIDFTKMMQINKHSKRKRPIRQNQNVHPYPVATDSDDTSSVVFHDGPPSAPPPPEGMIGVEYPDLVTEVPGTSALLLQVDSYMRSVQPSIPLSDNQNMECNNNVFPNRDNQSGSDNFNSEPTSQNDSTAALVHGRPWYDSRPPHTPASKLKPVPGIDPLSNCNEKPKKKRKIKRKAAVAVKETESEDILDEYTTEINGPLKNIPLDDDCIICCEPLSAGSSYNGDTTVVQLTLCPHKFHKACIAAMHRSGPKDNCLQCPVCKTIHGVKCGIQPPGEMVYHVLPYSLPGYSECDTIRIIYDFSSGTQGPDHPNPGKKYTARGFPRHCYLPDNEMGRKVLRLLVKAWKRRLIFTIGRSSTTGEENTVTWNEIHHKTEFGCNKRGHGFPDPNYFTNVLEELEAHGIKDDQVYLWSPA